MKIGLVDTSTPGANGNTTILFDSTVSFGTGLAGDPHNSTLQGKLSRVSLGLENSHLGTLKAYRSVDKGTNWDQVGGDISVAAASSTDISGPYSFLVDTYSDFRISWVNGGSAQTTWRPEVTGVEVGDRSAGV